jgi:hypothetical protein
VALYHFVLLDRDGAVEQHWEIDCISNDDAIAHSREFFGHPYEIKIWLCDKLVASFEPKNSTARPRLYDFGASLKK